jgi:hypothetical protein
MTVERLDSLLNPTTTESVLQCLTAALTALNAAEQERPVVKYASLWTYSEFSEVRILAKQMAKSFCANETYSPQESATIVGSPLEDPPAGHIYYESVVAWAGKTGSVEEQTASPKPSDLMVSCRVAEASTKLHEPAAFLSANGIGETDILCMLPVTAPANSAGTETVSLKGLLALYVDRDTDVEHVLNPIGDILSYRLANLMERVRLRQVRLLREELSSCTSMLFSDDDALTRFLDHMTATVAALLAFDSCSVYLFDQATDHLCLGGTTGIYEISKGRAARAKLPDHEYSRVFYDRNNHGKFTWDFFSDSLTEPNPEAPPSQRLCIRTNGNDFGCRSAEGTCSKFSETAARCELRLDTVIRDREGKSIGVMRCVNRKHATTSNVQNPVPSTDEQMAVAEFCDALGVLLELKRRTDSSDQLLARIGHELSGQTGLILQNLDEIERLMLSHAPGRGSGPERKGHLRNLLSETGYSTLIVQYYTNIATLLSLNEEQVRESKRPLALHVFLSKAIERIRHQARERGTYIQYSEGIEQGKPRILADLSLDLALINIMNNAVQYCAFCTCPLVDWKEKNDHYELSISDLGIALPKGVPPKTLFIAGYRGPEAKAVFSRGTGFGLAVAEHVIRTHGFEVQAQCPGGQIASRNIFAIDYLRTTPSDRLADLGLRRDGELLIDDRRHSSLSLHLDSDEQKALHRYGRFQMPISAVPSLREVPHRYLAARLHAGEHLKILAGKHLDKPLYYVTFVVRIPREEVLG